MAIHHKHGQRVRRITERLTNTEKVQDIIVDVVADQQQQINALARRVNAVEKKEANR